MLFGDVDSKIKLSTKSKLLTSSAITAVAFSVNFMVMTNSHAACLSNGTTVTCDDPNYPNGILPGVDFVQVSDLELVVDDSSGPITIGSSGDTAGVQNGVGILLEYGNFRIGGQDLGDNGDLVTQVGAETGQGITITTTGDTNFAAAIYSASNGSVEIENHATLSTSGVGARAIMATSRDGDVTVTNTGDITTTGGGIDYVQGSRGITIFAYNSGSVVIENSGAISTSGSYSRGMQASTGVGSGTLTITNTGAVSTEGTSAQAINAPHYSSGIATINNSGDLSTAGNYSDGIRVIEASFENNFGETLTSQGGEIVINNSGSISTMGDFGANGIEADIRIVNTRIANASANISITNSNTILTEGNESDGIFSRNAVSGLISITNSGSINVLGDYSRGITAQKFEGYGGGDITIVNTGNINTSGIRGRALDAFSLTTEQSNITIINTGNIVTAGGGDNYFLGARAITVSKYGAGSVRITNDGTLSTSGQFSRAISAFTAPDPTASIDVMNNGAISTTGDDAEGIGIYHYSSGAGNITNTASITTGGNYSSAIQAEQDSFTDSNNQTVTATGNGNIVINNSGSVTTDGTRSRGIDTRINVQGTAATTIINTGNITTFGGGDFYLDGARGISANTFGTGNISITNSGNITTMGQFSRGIHAYTAAGGNGNIQITNSGSITTSNDDAEGIQAFGFSSGTTDIVNTASIATQGTASSGIASFVDEFENIDGDLVTPLANGGLSITNSGSISTTGDSSRGIYAYSSVDGGISVETTGDVVSSGIGSSSAIQIATPDNISVMIGEGAQIIGGRGDNDAGVKFGTEGSGLGGSDNTLTNAGLIGNQSGIAIFGQNGNDTVLNSGTIIGTVSLGIGQNSLQNLIDGTIVVGSSEGQSIDVGAGNIFTNAGTLNVGGTNSIQTLNISGNYNQTSTGVLEIDIDDQAAVQQTDIVSISGSAQLAGTIVPNAINLALDENQFGILTTTEGLNVDGLTVQDSFAALDFNTFVDGSGNSLILEVLLPDLGEVVEDVVAESGSSAAASGTSTEDLVETANALQAFEDTSGDNPAVAELFDALRTLETGEEVAAAIVGLQPNNQPGQAQSTQTSATGFSNAILSCAVESATYSITREGQCVWGRFSGRRFERDASQTDLGIEETGYEFAAGAQFALKDQWRLGVAASFESFEADISNLNTNLSNTDGERYILGAVVKNQWGPWNAYLNAAVGFSDLEHRRGTILGTARGDQDAFTFLSRFRVSYLHEFEQFYVKPRVDLQAVYTRFDEFTETGAGAANLTIHENSDWLFSFAPALEIGGQFNIGEDTIVRPFISGGLTVTSNNDVTTVASFALAPASAGTFSSTQEFDTVFADVSAGVTALFGDKITARIAYEGRFSETSDFNAGNIKLTYNF